MSSFNPDTANRLVVKVGSSLLIGDDDRLDRDWLNSLAEDLAHLKSAGCDVLVVSSGAIAIGSRILGIDKRRARLEDLQAAAAAGQVQLAHAWSESLAAHGITTAQILLTPDDTENRKRFLNARGTLARLLERSVIPIVNENDTVATEEIRYGDNDRLAARVAQLVMADALILLSDVDGLYTADPGTDSTATHIPRVRKVDDAVLAIAGETRSAIGSGGMATKVLAARIATQAGCATIVASGADHRPLEMLRRGGACTVFEAADSPAAARKQWLAGVLEVQGTIVIDTGAAEALARGGSLLPVGVTGIRGTFRRGDVVSVVNDRDIELGRGLAEYSSEDAERLQGCHSGRIAEILGYRGRAVMIHRDELVLSADDS